MTSDENFYIFLDIDGVFTSTRVYRACERERGGTWAKYDPIAIDFFNFLSRKYPFIKYSLSTTWLRIYDYRAVTQILKSAGLIGKIIHPTNIIGNNVDITEDSFNLKTNKEQQVSLICKLMNIDKSQHLCVDDDYMYNKEKHNQVFTDTMNGLLEIHMEEIENYVKEYAKTRTET